MRLPLPLAAWRSLLLVLLMGALFGLLTLTWSLRDWPRYSSSATFEVLPGPVLQAQPSDSASESADVETELVLLNAPALRLEVADRVGADDLKLSAVQVGSAPVVTVTATTETEQVAVAAADAAAQVYSDRRAATLAKAAAATAARLDAQIQQTEALLAQLDAERGVAAEAERSALVSQLQRMVGDRSQATLAAAGPGSFTRVLASAGQAGAEEVSGLARRTAVATVLGLVLGVSVVLAVERRSRRLTSADQLDDTGATSLLPVVPVLDSPNPSAMTDAAADALALHLSALRGAPGAPPGRPLVLVGQTEGVGTTVLAVGLAVASARRSPTVLITAGDALEGGAVAVDPLPVDAAQVVGLPVRADAYRAHLVRTTVDDLWVLPVGVHGMLGLLERRASEGLLDAVARSGSAVVVDAPALSRSSAGLDLARSAGGAVLVVGLDVTTRDDVGEALRTLRAADVDLTGVLVTTPTRRLPPGPLLRAADSPPTSPATRASSRRAVRS